MTEPVPEEESYLCDLHLIPVAHHETWHRGRLITRCRYEKGAMAITDLRDGVEAFVGSPLDVLSLHLPIVMLDEIAEHLGADRSKGLQCPAGLVDPVIGHLGAVLLSGLGSPAAISQSFFDQVALAIGTHVLCRYGGLQTRMQRARGGLSASRERRAKELLAARLNEDISMDEVAKACGLSRSHFSTSFRLSTGMSPHTWLLNYKVDKAKQLLKSPSVPLVEIALACGFADQSHLTRRFSEVARVTPAAWRRAQLEG